jgi:type III secretory pathway component EscS
MSDQNFKTHSRYVPFYHFITPTLILALIVGSGIGLFHACSDCTDHAGLHNALLFFITGIVLLLLWWYCRVFALKAQDRAIRAEENFRHFVATGKPLDSRLRMGQIVALRFAGDDEFVALAKQAIDENLNTKQIKMAIKNWRADNYRA